jgi:HEAT repeat protein
VSSVVCPTCESPIDPARAPVARVRGTAVLTFCSRECADAPSPKPADPAAKPTAPAPGRPAARAAVPTPVPAEVSTRVESPPRRSRRRVIALLCAIIAGGMVAAIVDGVAPSRSTSASAASEAAEPRPAPAPEPTAAPVEPEEPGELDPARLLERARTELRGLLESSSPRLQRVAAMALVRERDPAAVARLRALLASESSELVKIDIAHALARAGDPAGEPALLRGLNADRRDVRVDAARALARMGDDRGARVLRSLLSYKQYQISAAAVLAERGDADGLELLRDHAGGNARTDEQRMRALVALGRAGDASVADQLAGMLEDQSHRVGAADALAALGDPRAVPALVEQLAHPSLRVGAAQALRRMKAEVALEPLALALVSGGDVARVSAAEVVLILLGDPQEAKPD